MEKGKHTEMLPFGRDVDGRDISLYRISVGSGASVLLTDYGAAVVGITVPDKNGVLGDVALGYDSLSEYKENGGFFGAVAGRCANRLGGGRFTLNGRQYETELNDGGVNTLHGGFHGFDKKVWAARYIDGIVRFDRISYNGEGGFPGKAEVGVTYCFGEDLRLIIEYEARCDYDTVMNLTNHTYFNLAGHDGESGTRQLLYLNSDFFTPAAPSMQLTGEIRPVAGTAFDFRTMKEIGRDIDADDEQLKIGGGYDHNFVLRKGERGELSHAATLQSESSGRRMEVYTTESGVQFYAGNNIEPCRGKQGARYERRQGVCLETQCFPDAMRNTHFPSPILRKGQVYHSRTEYRFSVAEQT